MLPDLRPVHRHLIDQVPAVIDDGDRVREVQLACLCFRGVADFLSRGERERFFCAELSHVSSS